MWEFITFGVINFPVTPLGFVTSGYLDTSILVPLQSFQSTVVPMFGASVVAACGPQRLMYDEDVKSFIYVSEVMIA